MGPGCPGDSRIPLMQFAPPTLDSEEESMTGSAKHPEPRACSRNPTGEREPTPHSRLRCARGATTSPPGLEAWADQVTSRRAKGATVRDA